MKEVIIQQGAEAILIRRDAELIKRRVKKGYRFKELDEKLRRSRTKKEARLLEKSEKEIFVPIVKKVSEFEIEMEFISGKKLSDNLDEMKNWRKVCFEIGQSIAKLHDAGIIHGDLTTSNMIWKEEGEALHHRRSPPRDNARIKHCANRLASSLATRPKLYFIDFGLGFNSHRAEDKAVDLHLIKQALEAKHFKNFEKFFEAVLAGYKISRNHKEVMKRLEKVEKRGRYKKQG